MTISKYVSKCYQIYTPEDIDEKYCEEEFYKRLEAMHEAYFEAEESINDLLDDYDDMLPNQSKKHWKNQVEEILRLMKSHERQLRAWWAPE